MPRFTEERKKYLEVWVFFDIFCQFHSIKVDRKRKYGFIADYAFRNRVDSTKAQGIRHNWLSVIRNTLRLDLGTIQNGDVGIRHKFFPNR